MENDHSKTTNLKEFASLCGITSRELIDLLEDFPELHFWRVRKRKKKFRTLIPSDVERIRVLLPTAVRSLA